MCSHGGSLSPQIILLAPEKTNAYWDGLHPRRVQLHGFTASRFRSEVGSVEADELAPGIEMIQDRKQIFDHMHTNSVVFTY